jgi:uncharacterized membrane protein YciS (DUF1049 family)
MFVIYIVVYNIVLYQPTFTVHNLAAMLFGVVGSVFLWLETVRLWKEKPF